MKTIYFDIGYSSIKTETYRNIPSIVGPARDLSDLSIVNNHSVEDNINIELNGKKYFVGSLAQNQSSNPAFSLKKNRYDSEQGKVLVDTAIALLTNTDDEVGIITGLPVDYQKSQRQKLEETLLGYRMITHNGDLKLINVMEVKILPQPMGIFFHHFVDDQGSPIDINWSKYKVGIIDIGYGTTDIAAVDKGVYIDKLSRSTKVAMNSLNRLVSNALQRDFDHRWEPHTLNEPIRKRNITLKGQFYDIAKQVEEGKRSLADQLISWIEVEWPDYEEMDVILLGGGGGAALHSYLRHDFHITLVNNPERAVLNGFKKYGVLMEKVNPPCPQR